MDLTTLFILVSAVLILCAFGIYMSFHVDDKNH